MNDSSQKIKLEELHESISTLIKNTEWSPKGMSGNSVVNMIEVKAYLLNAQKKIKTIANNEGYYK